MVFVYDCELDLCIYNMFTVSRAANDHTSWMPVYHRNVLIVNYSLRILIAWKLWEHQNDCVFNNASPCAFLIVRTVEEEGNLRCAAGAQGFRRFSRASLLVAEFSLLVVGEFLLSSREDDTRSWGNFSCLFLTQAHTNVMPT